MLLKKSCDYIKDYMVRFQIMSDIHIETYNGIPNFENYITPKSPYLILAGDIGHIENYEQLLTFLTDLCGKFRVVLYVLGNHEYYNRNNIDMNTMLQYMNDIVKQIPNLYLLNRSSVTIGNVCVAGCTLWSYHRNYIPPYIVRIPEMDTQLYNDLYQSDLDYIKYMINYCIQHKLKLVIVTHHCPTYSVLKKHDNDRFKTLYASRLDYLLSKKYVHSWICGHNHNNFDVVTSLGTRLVSNQLGKPKDRILDFHKTKIITV